MTAQPKSNHLQLRVTNFGPIARADIDLRPMTVFVGPSNTGKSYLAILIYALHRFFNHYQQSIRLGGDSAIERGLRTGLTNSDDTDGAEFDRLARWTADTFPTSRLGGPSPEVRGRLPEFVASLLRPILRDMGSFDDGLASEVCRDFGTSDVRRLSRNGSRGGLQVHLESFSSSASDADEPFRYEFTTGRGGPQLTSSIPDGTPLSMYDIANSWLAPYQVVLPIVRHNLLVSDEVGRQRARADLLHLVIGLVFPSVAGPFSRAAYYLPAARSGIMQAPLHAASSIIERSPLVALDPVTRGTGLSGVVADFLARLVSLGTPTVEEAPIQADGVPAKLEERMLRGTISIGHSTTGFPQFYYRPDGWRTQLPLMHTSSMVSELAPVVLYLRHIVRPGEVLIIEEPESHLHPKKQVEFVRFLAEVVKSGVRVMITTHSEWVLDELTNLVRLSSLTESEREAITGSDLALSPDELGVWLFEPKKKPRGSVVKELEFDEDFGGFRTGFDEVAIGTYNNYAAISNQISEAKAEHNSG